MINSEPPHDVDESTALTSINEKQPLTGEELSSLKHSDTEETIEEICTDYIDEITQDFKNNLFIVSLPGFFTNTIWRLMNLYGIADTTNVSDAIWMTSFEIAPIVFLLCSIIDYIRRFITNKINLSNTTDHNNFNINNIGIELSIILGFKFYCAVVFWTIGYEIGTIIDYNSENKFSDNDSNSEIILIRGIFAGIGNYIGLLIACELVNIYQYIIYKYDIYDPETHYSSLGVAFRGFFEGIVWSTIADLLLYHIIGKIFDSIIIGILASLSFTISGIFTSIFGLFYKNNSIKPYDLPSLGGGIGADGSVRFNHSLNKSLQGPSVYSVSANFEKI